MRDLIDRQWAIEHFRRVKYAIGDRTGACDFDFGYAVAIDFCISRLEIFPSVQPEPEQKTGKWIYHHSLHVDDEFYPARLECNVCNHFIDFGCDSNYCPNCGARMEKEWRLLLKG